MSFAALLDRVRGIESEKNKSVTARYADAVQGAAEGRDLSAEKVVELLAAAGKTAADFEADVAVRADRNVLRQRVAALPVAERDRAAAVKAIERLDAEFEKTRAAHRAARAPFEAVVSQCDGSIMEASAARDQLFAGCPDDGLRAKLADLMTAEAAAEQAVRDKRDQLHTVEVWAAGKPHDGKHDRTRQIADAEARLPEVRAAVAAAEAEVQRLRGEREQAEEAMRSA